MRLYGRCMKHEAGMVADRERAATGVWYRAESS